MFAKMDQELANIDRYHRLIDTLVAKTKSKRYLLYRDPSLRWIVANQEQTADMIVQYLKNPDGFHLSEFKKQNIYIDKKRVTFNTEWPEKMILMNMGKIISEYTEPLLADNLYSYRKNRGPHLAIQSLTKFLQDNRRGEMFHVFKTDIDDYTNSMDKQTLLGILESKTPIRSNPIFHSIFSQLMNFSYVENAQSYSTKDQPFGVPIGIPLVPLLNNLYLMSLDEAMSAHGDVFYARYGDDVMIISSDRIAYAAAVNTVERILVEKKLRMKSKKTMQFEYGFKTHAPQPDESKLVLARRIEWLGFSIYADGEIGPKKLVYREFVAKTKSEMYRLMNLSRQFPGERSEKVEFLKNNFKLLWANPNVLQLARKFSGIQNAKLFEQMDQHFASYFTRKLARLWNISRKDAWSVYREVKVPSLKTSNQWESYDWVA